MAPRYDDPTRVRPIDPLTGRPATRGVVAPPGDAGATAPTVQPPPEARAAAAGAVQGGGAATPPRDPDSGWAGSWTATVEQGRGATEGGAADAAAQFGAVADQTPRSQLEFINAALADEYGRQPALEQAVSDARAALDALIQRRDKAARAPDGSPEARDFPDETAITAAQAALDQALQARAVSEQNVGFWRLKLYDLLGQQNPEMTPEEKEILAAQVAQEQVKAQQAQLEWQLEQADAPHKAAIQAQLDSLALQAAALKQRAEEAKFTEDRADAAYQAQLRPYGIEAAGLANRQAAANIGETDSRTAVNASTVAVNQSQVPVNASVAASNTATAGRTAAETPGVAAQSSISQQMAAGGYGASAARKASADADAQGLANAGTAETNRQAAEGPDATYARQVREGLEAGTLSGPMAADSYFNRLYGGSQFERRQEANKQAGSLFSKMADQGNLVMPGQRYVVGGEPGGMLQQGFGQLGLDFAPTELHPMGAPAYARSIGVDIGATQGLPAESPFNTDGSTNPDFRSPLMGGDGQPPTYAQAAARGAIVLPPGMTPNDYKALRARKAAAGQQAAEQPGVAGPPTRATGASDPRSRAR